MRYIYAGAVDLSQAGRFRRGRETYQAVHMREPFILDTPIGRKIFPAGHILVSAEATGKLEAVAPHLFEQTFFRVPFCAPVESDGAAMQVAPDNMTEVRNS